jgi:methyl-accepting chemotaxis protein
MMEIKPEEEKLFDAELREKRGQTGLQLSKICAVIVGVMTFGLLVAWLLTHQEYNQVLIVAGLMLACGIGAGLYPYFHRQGKARTGAYVFVTTMLFAIFVSLEALPQITIAGSLGYIAVICLANLLLGNRETWWVTVLSTIALLINMISAQAGFANTWFTSLDATVANWLGILFIAIALPAVAVIIGSIMGGQNEQFREARRAGLEIERRANVEQEQREHLQSTIARYVDYLAQVAKGNLAARVTLDGKERGADDPLIVLGHNLNDMTASLQKMIGQIREAANSLGSAAAEILAATTQQASGASEQAAAVSQTTTTVDEVKAITEQASMRVQEVASASQRTVETARAGQRAVQETIESMTMIRERVEGIAENILALSDQTQQIGEIIATVNEIAAQSNMLALNASVEAARAGEHGKGFAVVAMEVRNLAEQSRQATAQVKAILSEIQRATNSTVMATEEGTKGVERGVQLSSQAREAIEQLAAVINESAQIATQVVVGGRQQQTGIEQIATAMQNINQANIQNLASTRQAEKSAQSLNELARQLNETVEQYRV